MNAEPSLTSLNLVLRLISDHSNGSHCKLFYLACSSRVLRTTGSDSKWTITTTHVYILSQILVYLCLPDGLQIALGYQVLPRQYCTIKQGDDRVVSSPLACHSHSHLSSTSADTLAHFLAKCNWTCYTINNTFFTPNSRS